MLGRIIRRPKYTYLSPIDKPVMPLCLNSLSQFSAELMQWATIDSAGLLCPELSVVGGAIVFRCLTQGVCTIIRVRGDSEGKVERKDVSELRPALRWIHKVLIVDAVRDYQFYGLETRQINKLVSWYLRPGILLANLVNAYLILNFFRGAYYLLSEPEFQHFCNSTTYLPSLSLYDPLFLTPLLVIASTFLILKGSRHPLMIKYVHPANILHCFNLAFMVGLLFVPVPGIYHLAYLGLALGHLGIRFVRYLLRDTGYSLQKLLKFKR